MLKRESAHGTLTIPGADGVDRRIEFISLPAVHPRGGFGYRAILGAARGTGGVNPVRLNELERRLRGRRLGALPAPNSSCILAPS